MSIKINLFRQACQPDPTPRDNVTTPGNPAVGHERFCQGKFDILPSRKKKTISTQPPTEKRAHTDWKTSRTFRNAAKLLKKVFRPCGSAESELSQSENKLTIPANEPTAPRSEPFKPFTQVPPRPVHADNRGEAGTKNSAQTGTVAVNGKTITPPKRKESLVHWQAHSSRDAAQLRDSSPSNTELQQANTVIPPHPPKSIKRPSIPVFRPTESSISSKRTTPAAPPRPPKSDKRPSQRVLLATEKMKTVSLREESLIIEGLKAAKETGHWLPVEPENYAPPTGLSKSEFCA
ncbi:hypothetical protein KQH60_09650 [Mycetohabitans sp. B8]|uniref:hypothetical protein n=1 Tax=Mycetohabitans sp. B8 TaxID=2841845 RepID=UPI001F24FB8E|nr:hypothetical protein [Mycetohabitans sp. B8]MCG1042786.1 hypothetical protein [Mycetohabitans sp. B8]